MAVRKSRPIPTPCELCGGERVVASCTSYLVSADDQAKPKKYRPATHHTPLQALTCTECGHTTLYAQEPRLLKEEECPIANSSIAEQLL